MKRILCYGDSNTYGHNPKDGSRLAAEVRWTGVLASLLGDDYQIIEEGLCGRTTVLNSPLGDGRNGKDYLLPCFQSQYPVDIVILMLGTNDMQVIYNSTCYTIAAGIEELLKILLSPYNGQTKPLKIILVSPIHIGDTSVNPFFHSLYGGEAGTHLSEQLAPIYEELAKKYHCLYLNAARVAEPSPADGLHMNTENHSKLAQAIFRLIKLNNFWF